MRALGRHVLVELYGCDAELLKKVDAVREIMVEAAEACQAAIVDVAFHEFAPFGVSGVVVIAESHLAIHTWPEYQYAAVDIFTCGETIDPEQAVRHIVSRFDCPRASIMEVRRGIIPGYGPLPHKVEQGSERSQ